MKNTLTAILCTAVLVGCSAHVQSQLPPAVVTKTINVAVPVPCPALTNLGSEPSYADTDGALAIAPDIFEATRLLLKGRLQRAQRLSVYAAARVACTF